MIRLSLCFALLSLNAAAAANPAPPTPYPTEFWVSEKDGWTVRTGPCDSGMCAWLVDFKTRLDRQDPREVELERARIEKSLEAFEQEGGL